MNGKALKALRTDINAALEEVRIKHNLDELAAANASYREEGSFTFQLKGREAGGMSERAVKYTHNYQLYGLPPLGTKFTTFDGKDFEITGWISRKNVQCKHAGKSYRVRMESVKRHTSEQPYS